jgi:transposase InsO family protein
MDLDDMQILDQRTGGASMIHLIAFLDDASRFIMHYRLIPDKRSEKCAAVLADALQMWAPPCLLGSDNGGEFRGAAFTSLLRQYGATAWRTAPSMPQQNGKMERFWQTLDKARDGFCSEDTMAYIISQYNHIWEHKAVDMTLEAARRVGVNWRAPYAIIESSIFRNVVPSIPINQFSFQALRIIH